MKIFRLISNDNGEIIIGVPKTAVTNLNEIIQKYNQSEWGDKDDIKKVNYNEDMEDDILELHRLFNPS